MKARFSIFIFLIGMISLMNVSCSNDNGQKEKIGNGELNKFGDLPFVNVNPKDTDYQMLVDFSNFIIDNSLNDNNEWVEMSQDHMQSFFNEYPIDKRPKVECHEHCSCCPSQHLVTVHHNGNHYQVLIESGNPPKVISIVNFGIQSPCGVDLCP